MKTLTLQELFTISATHILKQGKRAAEGAGCKYRTSEGLKCAIGAAIPDSLYDPAIEGKIAALALDPAYIGHIEEDVRQGHELDDSDRRMLKLAEILGACGIDHTHKRLAGTLQSIHDTDSPEDWARNLARLAADLNLEMVPMGTEEAA